MNAADGTYSELVREYFLRPRHVGELAAAEDVLHAQAGSIDAGAIFRFSARLQAGRLTDVKVRVYGCPHCIAAGSWLADQLPTLNVAQIEAWHWREAQAALDVPTQKRGRLLILEDAAHALARAWRQHE